LCAVKFSLDNKYLDSISEKIKDKIHFAFPNIQYKFSFKDKPNILYGRTKIEKKDKVKAIITIHISKNLLSRANIKNAVKIILAHELCHVVNPFNPDVVMQTYLPEIWCIWEKLEKEKAIECYAKVTEVKTRCQ